ncbi:MAG: hypothetical protein K6F00_08020 [Lachnospiraceae bacterium]|nr:hypothetical protein [Lachnospiraceae bacterium]
MAVGFSSSNPASPFKTGGNKKKLIIILVGTFLALGLMLGIGYYFSGRMGGGDEAALRSVADGFMTSVSEGNLQQAKKYCSDPEVLANIGLSSSYITDTLTAFTDIGGLGGVKKALKSKKIINTIEEILPSLASSMVESYTIEQVNAAPRSGSVDVKCVGLNLQDLIAATISSSDETKNELIESTFTDIMSEIDKLTGNENASKNKKEEVNVKKLVVKTLKNAIKKAGKMPGKEYRYRIHMELDNEKWIITGLTVI